MTFLYKYYLKSKLKTVTSLLYVYLLFTLVLCIAVKAAQWTQAVDYRQRIYISLNFRIHNYTYRARAWYFQPYLYLHLAQRYCNFHYKNNTFLQVVSHSQIGLQSKQVTINWRVIAYDFYAPQLYRQVLLRRVLAMGILSVRLSVRLSVTIRWYTKLR